MSCAYVCRLGILQDFFYFVAKYRNFTKAARVLGSNQPNITHTMNKLEDQLHCVLFIRSNRGVTLTPEGEMLYTAFPRLLCRYRMPRRS